MNTTAGYREIAHTADWELEVWAPDLPALLEQAGRGMYALAGVRLKTAQSLKAAPGLLAAQSPEQTPVPQDAQTVERRLELAYEDAESLLVRFLSELLYFSEQEGIAFSGFDLRLDGQRLQARLSGAQIAALNKEIKAVTYHNLAGAADTGSGLEARHLSWMCNIQVPIGGTQMVNLQDSGQDQRLRMGNPADPTARICASRCASLPPAACWRRVMDDNSLEQAVNAATLPGLVGHVVVMPDMHQGYGFPIGGVAATRYPDGVISPGAIGYDINCGVRLLARRSNYEAAKPLPGARWRRRSTAHCPSGVGEKGAVRLTEAEIGSRLPGGRALGAEARLCQRSRPAPHRRGRAAGRG